MCIEDRTRDPGCGSFLFAGYAGERTIWNAQSKAEGILNRPALCPAHGIFLFLC